MKRILLYLLLSCSFFLGKGVAQEDSLLQDVLKKIERNDSYKLIGCITNLENIEGTELFIKKAFIEFENISVFIMSIPFSDENDINCQEIIICKQYTGEHKIINIKKNQSLNSFLRKMPKKEFLDKKRNQIVCGILD